MISPEPPQQALLPASSLTLTGPGMEAAEDANRVEVGQRKLSQGAFLAKI